MKKESRFILLVSKIGDVLLLVGAACLLLTIIAFSASAIYEWIKPPSDMHLPGLISAIVIFYVAPIAGVILILGLVLRFGALFILRKKSRKSAPDS